MSLFFSVKHRYSNLRINEVVKCQRLEVEDFKSFFFVLYTGQDYIIHYKNTKTIQ